MTVTYITDESLQTTVDYRIITQRDYKNAHNYHLLCLIAKSSLQSFTIRIKVLFH